MKKREWILIVDGNDTNASQAGIQATADAYGNPVGETGAYADTLNGTPGNDHILTGALADDVYAMAGNDWIEGQTGNDCLFGYEGNDRIEGGADSDILAGGLGDDRLFGGSQQDLDTAIQQGNLQTGTGQKGDWLSGNAGNDTLVGGADNDILTSGEGSDLLIAGAGDDNLLGDADYTVQIFLAQEPSYSIDSAEYHHTGPETQNWGYQEVNGIRTFSPVVGLTAPPGGAADVIHAGVGADRVWAGFGDDLVYGEDGNDQLYGEDDNDVILGGGEGNDVSRYRRKIQAANEACFWRVAA